MQTICGWCGVLFEPLESEIRRGNGKFCSKICSARDAASDHGRMVKIECAYCKVELIIKESRLKRSKSGLIFCCIDHKNKFQKSETRNRDKPKHVNYRKLAFSFYENICYDCGYDEHPEILEVHHLDKNRENNNLDNLRIVCPNCHTIRHKIGNVI